MGAQGNIVKRGWLAAAIVVAILVIDQVIKIWVKTHMMLHEQIEVLSWFKIVFIENNGMAYGMEIGSKLVLSIFRIVAIGFLGWYIAQQVKKQARWGYIICLAMIMAGAAGNIFDSMFFSRPDRPNCCFSAVSTGRTSVGRRRPGDLGVPRPAGRTAVFRPS